MNSPASTVRREFLKFLAASPYVAALGGVGAWLEQVGFAQRAADAANDVLASPADALVAEQAHQRFPHVIAGALHRRLEEGQEEESTTKRRVD